MDYALKRSDRHQIYSRWLDRRILPPSVPSEGIINSNETEKIVIIRFCRKKDRPAEA
jgi:hypothetical protein